MQTRASFIQIGEDRYLGTIRRGATEEVVQENGKNVEFKSAAAAVLAARMILFPKIPGEPAILFHQPDPVAVQQWKAERLRRRQEDRDIATLMNVQVVTKRRVRRA